MTFLYNFMMLKYLGESGVAAITIVLYGQFLFNALYMGFSMGVAPVISYNYGSDNRRLLRRIFKICISFVSVSSILITAIALVASPVIVEIFTPKGSDTYEIAKTGFFLFSVNIYLCGHKYFCLGNVYGVFRWEGICGHFICPYICHDCDQYFFTAVFDRCKRDLACGSGSRVYDAVFVLRLFLDKKKEIPLSVKRTWDKISVKKTEFIKDLLSLQEKLFTNGAEISCGGRRSFLVRQRLKE